MRIFVVSSVVGRLPREITYSFVLDEVCRIAKRGIEIHVMRPKKGAIVTSIPLRSHGMTGSVNVPSNTLIRGT